jgi:hypothetical protein
MVLSIEEEMIVIACTAERPRDSLHRADIPSRSIRSA